MFTGVHNDEINVRLSEADRSRFLSEYDGARIFSPMKGMEMKEYVVVPPSVADKPAVLARWIRKGFEFASSLPAKKAKTKTKTKTKTAATKPAKKAATKSAKNSAARSR
jgi:hypothetical protein